MARKAFNKMTLGKTAPAKTKGKPTTGPQGSSPAKAPTLTHGKGMRQSVKGATVKTGKHNNKTGNLSHGKGGK